MLLAERRAVLPFIRFRFVGPGECDREKRLPFFRGLLPNIRVDGSDTDFVKGWVFSLGRHDVFYFVGC